ncbi:MAG: hypothetical protein P8045_11405 [Candidatus Thiodiazotropha sp.]
MNTSDYQSQELRRKNIRLAWVLAGLALFFLVTSFPFWGGLFKLIGTQAVQ